MRGRKIVCSQQKRQSIIKLRRNERTGAGSGDSCSKSNNVMVEDGDGTIDRRVNCYIHTFCKITAEVRSQKSEVRSQKSDGGGVVFRWIRIERGVGVEVGV